MPRPCRISFNHSHLEKTRTIMVIQEREIQDNVGNLEIKDILKVTKEAKVSNVPSNIVKLEHLDSWRIFRGI